MIIISIISNHINITSNLPSRIIHHNITEFIVNNNFIHIYTIKSHTQMRLRTSQYHRRQRENYLSKSRQHIFDFFFQLKKGKNAFVYKYFFLVLNKQCKQKTFL